METTTKKKSKRGGARPNPGPITPYGKKVPQKVVRVTMDVYEAIEQQMMSSCVPQFIAAQELFKGFATAPVKEDSKLKEKVEQLTEQLDEAQAQNESSEELAGNFAKAKKQAEKKLKKLTQDNEKLKEQNEWLTGERLKLHQRVMKLEAQQTSNEEAQGKEQVLTNQVYRLTQQLEETQKREAGLRTEVVRLADENRKMQVDFQRKLDESAEKNKKLTQENKYLDIRMKRLTGEHAHLYQKNLKLEKQVEELKRELRHPSLRDEKIEDVVWREV